MLDRTVASRRLVREATEELRASGVPEPEVSAEVLLAELLGLGRSEVAARDIPVSGELLDRYRSWISRRRGREPVQRILGYAYFRKLKLEVDGSVLVPRADTESVVEVALRWIDGRGGEARVLDLGTGSGAIALSVALERPRCEVYASDVSPAALEVARRNTASSGVEVTFLQADLLRGLEELAGRIDLLVSNPPYVESGEIDALMPEVRLWDPPEALDGGPDGLSFYRRIFAEIPELLAPGAGVILEIGDGQAQEVLDLGEKAGFRPLGVERDLAGSERVVAFAWEVG
ncbi:MAG: peptide chain release factor N(5)-glutamine methyltransferase [Rubrobacteraceae bacterium]|nr:peptide chain release factor N(5)-glutamine methyltransferase [Rubrobacteraceae bacterium]MCL6438417.1 peptide chain release factor N(5)-glutamine methyltransferase [Rubrobacteraceae bacterium]